MNDSTRRNFLTVAGAGAVVGAAAMAAPGSAGAATSDDATLPPDAEGSMAAYIHDVKKGEVVVMIEGREVVVTDHQLVARLARAFARAARS